MQYQSFLNHTFQFEDYLKKSFEEDIPSVDLTTVSLGLEKKHGKAKLIAKEDLALSGLDLFKESILWLEPNAELRFHFKDGDFILKDQIICEIKGDLLKVLQAERVGLNFLGKLSGIATLTKCFVNEVAHTKTKILDTRKTIPLYRDLCKKAVRDGGGDNHRINLSDAVLVKENHIRAMGNDIRKTIAAIRKNYHGPIELEVTNMDEVRLAVELRLSRLMLDNMTNDEMKEALAIIPREIETEASGNMTVDRVRSVAELGVDYISVGAITHSAPVADMSLLFLWDLE